MSQLSDFFFIASLTQPLSKLDLKLGMSLAISFALCYIGSTGHCADSSSGNTRMVLV
jgi:hypothetical protein